MERKKERLQETEEVNAANSTEIRRQRERKDEEGKARCEISGFICIMLKEMKRKKERSRKTEDGMQWTVPR